MKTRRPNARSGRTARRPSFRLEILESRQLLSADAMTSLLDGPAFTTGYVARLVSAPVESASFVGPLAFAAGSAAPSGGVSPDAGPAVGGPFVPSQIRRTYGFDSLSLDGSGQTIAIVDAYDNPTIASDLAYFNSAFGLPTSNFTKAFPGGSTPSYDSGWALETALDVEWAHAIAPKANILLVEAASASNADLLKAVDYAVAAGASQVSMSWGGGEYSGVTRLDSHFNKSGVTFLASSGDNGTEVNYPAVSPYVVGVGGTTITVDQAGNRISETAWSGSGGGTSTTTARPSYQTGFQTSTNRGVPDVSYDADLQSGVYVRNNNQWYGVGGTSAGAPQWAGLVALVNQGRAAAGLSPIGTGLAFGTNTALYGLAGGTSYTNAKGDFLDITSGSNGLSATTGYDNVTGLGSPVANLLVPDLVSYGTTVTTAPTAPAFGDASFEAVSVGTNGYAYNPTGSAWTFTGQAGLSANNSAFTNGNPAAPDGTQVGVIQNQGSISQAVAGFTAGKYAISFSAAQRGNYGSQNQTVTVLVDGSPIATIAPSGTAYKAYSTTATLTSGSHTVTFRGNNASGDATTFVDLVSIAQAATTPAQSFADASFEAVSAGPSGYAYAPSGGAWTYSGQAGISANNSDFTSGNPAAPDGTQVAFLQNLGSIAQAVTGFTAGNYTLSLLAAYRGNYGGKNQSIQVLVDGTSVGMISPNSSTYQSYSTTFSLASGSHTITLQGTNSAGDATDFVDKVAIAQAATTSGPVVGDASFENVPSGPSGYAYAPSGGAWTYSGQAGISANNSDFTNGNPAAPDGTQVAFLQNLGSIAQAVTGFTAGNYTLSLLAAYRGNNGGSNQSIRVLVDGNLAATFSPNSTTYKAYATTIALASGSHTITLQGTNSTGDSTDFVDKVSIASA